MVLRQDLFFVLSTAIEELRPACLAVAHSIAMPENTSTMKHCSTKTPSQTLWSTAAGICHLAPCCCNECSALHKCESLWSSELQALPLSPGNLTCNCTRSISDLLWLSCATFLSTPGVPEVQAFLWLFLLIHRLFLCLMPPDFHMAVSAIAQADVQLDLKTDLS